jgi:hypothetical protein
MHDGLALALDTHQPPDIRTPSSIRTERVPPTTIAAATVALAGVDARGRSMIDDDLIDRLDGVIKRPRGQSHVQYGNTAHRRAAERRDGADATGVRLSAGRARASAMPRAGISATVSRVS